jgi:hypothetical protein
METLQQIISAIFSNLSALGFTNTSATSIYGQIANTIGLIIYNTQVEIQNSQDIITNILIGQQGLGKPTYYTAAALQYQYGDNVVINTAINPVTGAPFLNYIYNPVDTTAQIINQAAFGTTTTGNNIGLFLKVATVTSGVLGPLSNDQFTAFSNYYQLFELAGLPVNIISAAANIINFNSVATYYASYDLPTLQAAIATFFANFENSFQFNGVFFDGDLEDYIKANVPGIRDFYITQTTVDNVPFSGSTVLSSGYFNYYSTILAQISYSPIA